MFDNFFLMFRRRNDISFFCRMLSLLYTLTFGVFSGQHIFHQFRQQTFFCPHFQQIFFSDFVATNYFNFFLSPRPPSQISNGASLTIQYSMQTTEQIPMTLPGWGLRSTT